MPLPKRPRRLPRTLVPGFEQGWSVVLFDGVPQVSSDTGKLLLTNEAGEVAAVEWPPTVDDARVVYVELSMQDAKRNGERHAADRLRQLLVDLMDAHEQTDIEDAIIEAHDALVAALAKFDAEERG